MRNKKKRNEVNMEIKNAKRKDVQSKIDQNRIFSDMLEA